MIYLLEDDESIRKLVIYTLESQGFSAAGFESAEKFWPAMEKSLPRLVLLDIMLPGEDGLSVLKRIRKSYGQLPVIMLTAKTSEYDRVLGLDTGADDYLSKPFGIMELMARIRAVLRRFDQNSGPLPPDFSVGPLRVLGARREVYVGRNLVELTYKEYELLTLFLRREGMVLTRDMLLETVWGPDHERENRTLDVHIRTLRAKLGEAGSFIRTIRGVGYKFSGDNP